MANAKKKRECENKDLHSNRCGCEENGAYAIFKINANGAAWGSIVGDINIQTDLIDLLDSYFGQCFNPETLKASGNVKIVEQPDGTYDISTETFEFEQGEASDSWEIEHNLNKYPNVVTVDSAGRQFQAEVTYDSLNKITISLNGATKGKAYLN